MNKKLCDIIEQQLPALLEGSLNSERAVQLRRHCDRCASCGAALHEYKRLVGDLYELGAAVQNASATDLNLTSTVMAEVKVMQEGAACLALLESGTEDTALTPENQAELNALKTDENMLSSLGAALAEATPEVNLVNDVMASVAAYKAGELLLEEEAGDANRLLEAFADDALDETGLARLEAAALADPRIQEEYEALCELKHELKTLGEAIEAHAPEADLLDTVMTSLTVDKAEPTTVVPFRSRTTAAEPTPPVRTRQYSFWYGFAAAAMLFLTIFLGLQIGFNKDAHSPDTIAANGNHNGGTSIATSENSNQESGEELQSTLDPQLKFRTAKRRISIAPTSGTEQPDAPSLSAQKLANQQRDALQPQLDAVFGIAQWANLTAEEARSLLSELGNSKETLAGLAEFMTPEEAAAMLRSLVKEEPEDPYLRYALARNYLDMPGYEAEAQEQLTALAELAPENGLAYYLEAELRLNLGDRAGALDALQQASTYDTVSPYAMDSAHYREQVFLANGMSPEDAELMSMLSSGTSSYLDLVDLAERFVDESEAAQNQGDSEAATALVDAATELGEQAVQGADETGEELTALSGYDILNMIVEPYMEAESAIEYEQWVDFLTNMEVALRSIMQLVD